MAPSLTRLNHALRRTSGSKVQVMVRDPALQGPGALVQLQGDADAAALVQHAADVRVQHRAAPGVDAEEAGGRPDQHVAGVRADHVATGVLHGAHHLGGQGGRRAVGAPDAGEQVCGVLDPGQRVQRQQADAGPLGHEVGVCTRRRDGGGVGQGRGHAAQAPRRGATRLRPPPRSTPPAFVRPDDGGTRRRVPGTAGTRRRRGFVQPDDLRGREVRQGRFVAFVTFGGRGCRFPCRSQGRPRRHP